MTSNWIIYHIKLRYLHRCDNKLFRKMPRWLTGWNLKFYLMRKPSVQLLHALFLLYLGPGSFCEFLEWLPLETLFGETPRLVQRWAELLSLEAQDSDRSACQSSRGQAASSGIAVLSPALFTLVTLQHLELTPGMSYRQCSSQGKWPVRLSEETNTLFTLPFISINSGCVFGHASEV